MYVDHTTHIERLNDGAIIPLDPLNADYADYLVWLGQGNTADAPPPVIEPVPAVVTMAQARLALLAAGRLAAVRDAIVGLQGDDGEAARVEWECRTTVERESPMVALVGGILGFDDAELDALFTDAAKR